MESVIETYIKTFLTRKGKKAVSDDHGTFTYAELYNYACIISANLKQKGVNYGDRVVIECERSKEYIGCLLGCWFIGAATIPLSDDYPQERLEYIKNDSKYHFLIDDNFVKNLDKTLSIEPIIPNIEDDGLVIYTSGSTGNPKGVIHNFLSMTAVATRNAVHEQSEKVEKNDDFGLTAPFTFIVGISLTIAGLALGKHIILVSDEIRKDPFKLAKYYDDNNVQSSFVPPKMIDFMLANNKSLKAISVGSERIVNLFYNNKPVLVNGYGSTETFGGVMAFQIDKPYENTPIGKPFGKEKAYVLDENNNEVEQGELCIAGYIATKYLNLEEKSKKVFVENPFKEKDGFPKMFRTGDIVKKLEDGNLVFIERKDWMIKINGQRVEPLEVESTIRRLNGIKQVAIKDWTAKNGITYLAAYYVCDDSLTEEEIREHCERNLTSYMVPTFYVKLKELPVNANGKLDRKNLPEPDIKNFKKEYKEPVGNIEKALCDAIEKVLSCGKVGRDDDFYLLGGDSIKSLEVINILDDLPIDAEIFFEGKTPKNIAELIENGGKNEIEFDRIEKDSYPLTPSQLGIYFPIMSNPTSLEYNNPLTITLDKNIDTNKLINAIEKSINNHKAYKCHIGEVKGVPSMIPYDATFKVNYIKTNDVEKELKSFIKVFDLNKDMLVRVNVYESENELVLAFDAHHIVFDGSTLAVLLKEIQNVYEGKDIYEEKTSICDLSLYEDAIKKSDKYVEAEKYFTEKFDDVEIGNDFPKDFEDEGKGELGNILLSYKVDEEGFSNYLKKNGITKNSFFLSIYSYVLAKFNGNNKSLVCVAESGRHSSMTFNTAGMLVKTIALHVDVSKNYDISDYIRGIQIDFKESCKHDVYPFTSLSNKYGIINDYMFVYQGNMFSTLKLNDKEYLVKGMQNPDALAKLYLAVYKEKEGYDFSFRYRKDLFLEEIIQSFASTYMQVLKEFMIKESFNDIKLVSDEQIKTLDSFNDDKIDIVDKTCIEYFREAVEKYKDNDLVVYKGKKYTYSEANVVINKVANYIVSLGLKNNDIVSVLIPRNEWIVLLTYGILKAGCAYEPLDNTYPSERLSYMVKDSGAKLLITTKELEPLIKDYNGKVLYVDEIEDLKDDKEVVVKNSLDDIFVMLYTSGTTGVPKGVMLTNKNAIYISQYHKKNFLIDENSISACYASYGFDACQLDLVTLPICGGTIHIIDEGIRLDMVALDKYYIDNKITHAIATTQVGRQYALFTKSPYLKCLGFGGETLVPFYREDAKFKVYNVYGPTETTIYVTNFVLDKLYYRVPIGKINPNMRGYIVDENMNRVPIGVPGELLVAGPQVGYGYHNLPEKTGKVFIENPFSDEEEYKVAYRTGDVIRYLADGKLDFIGRSDGQVKIRGFRIELTEVESVIREYKGIKDATVVAFDNPNGGKYLASYVVSDDKIDLNDLKRFIATKKPPYMVPEAMMQIEKIPLNQNHKVNKRALPVITKTKKSKSESVKTDNILVIKIKNILKTILNDDTFDYKDNLFEYGMNSLSIVRLSVLLNEEFGVNVDVKELLSDCSIYSIESHIINALLNNKITTKENNRVLKDEYLLNSSQVGIYTEYLKDEDSVKYNIPVVITYDKEKYKNLTVSSLKEALISVVNAHPSLKCTIDSNKDGKFVMIPHNGEDVVVDTFSLSNEEFEKLTKEFVRPHNLSKGVYRFTIAEVDDKIHLLLDIHHIMFDGFSQGIFFKDLNKAINGESLEEEDYSIFDLSVDEEEEKKTTKYNDAKAYYANLLSDVDGSTIIEKDSFEKEIIPSTYNKVENVLSVEKVKEFVKEHNITMNVFFLTAFSITLSRLTYQNKVCFTTVYNGRTTIDMNKIIGMTVKTLPFVANFEGKPNLFDILLENKNQIMNSMNNDIYSFSEIAREFDIGINTMFVYQGELEKNTDYQTRFLALNDLKSDIECEVRNDLKDFYFHVEYNQGKYSEDFIARIIKALVNVSNEMLSKDNINDILLTDENDVQEIDKFNQVVLDYDKRPIIYKICEIMKNCKNKEALVFKDKIFTYEELDIITNKVANYINSKGIGENDVVSILINRSEYMTILPLSVMKAGAAYEPIDSSYPDERINFMIQDANSKLLICDDDLIEKVKDYKGEILKTSEIKKLDNVNDVSLNTKEDDLFVLLYTSGTTGTPKGVMLSNANLSDFVAVDMKARKVDKDSIQTVYAGFGFDANLMETYAVLVNGGTLHIIEEDMRLDLPRLEEYFIKNKITNVFMTTQMARQFILFTKSPYIKTFAFGGEKITPFFRDDVKFEMLNDYGPSECSCYTNYFVIDKYYDRVPIGKVHPNTKAYIIDVNNNLLPVGAVGELSIAGPQVGKGYLNRPEKTASVFIENKFTNDEGYKILYKTGDLARLLPSGDVDIIGRNDGQVKVRGFRIELTEVEEVIRRFDGIKDVTVNAYDDAAGGKFIAAFVVSDKQINVQEMNAFIMKEKPAYIVPRITMQIDKIPLNANGKVDKRKLPKVDSSKLQENYVAPVNSLEQEFCDVFAKILGIEKVSACDDFFMLGGSSINAAQVVSYAFKKGYDLVYKNIFDNHTPRELAAFISKDKNVEVKEIEREGEFKANIEPAFVNNVVEKLDDLEISDIGDVLLFGATGFLGSHVLKELIETTNKNIICVVRKNDLQDSKGRLMTMLKYYFDNAYTELFEKRIFVVDGELLNPNISDLLKEYNYDTIINCAAVVKHFANDDSIEKTNTGGTINLINLAKKMNKKLIHVSTLSIAGESVNNNIPQDFKLKENMLDIGQVVDNKYTKSKFDAECEIRNAIINDGLRAKIVRVGNLMSRSSDGEFQINFRTNNFMNTIRAFKLMKCVPYDMLTHSVEFSQIDHVAKAIILIAKTNDKFNVFHVNNIHTIQMNNVVDELNKNGLDIKKVSAEDFGITLNKLLNTEQDVRSINSLLAYRSNQNEKRRTIGTDNAFTLNMLYRLGFYWPFPDNDYLSKLIDYLVSLDFLN